MTPKQKLQKLLTERNLTEKQAADELGVTVTAIKDWLAGRRPRPENITKLEKWSGGHIRKKDYPRPPVKLKDSQKTEQQLDIAYNTLLRLKEIITAVKKPIPGSPLVACIEQTIIKIHKIGFQDKYIKEEIK